MFRNLNQNILLNTLPEVNQYSIDEKLVSAKPLLIVNHSSKPIFSNSAFNNSFTVSLDFTLSDINSDPDLNILVNEFALSPFKKVFIESRIKSNRSGMIQEYAVEFEKIKIESEEYVLLIFNPVGNTSLIESRIDSIHAAIENGNIPVMIIDAEGKVIYLTKSFEKIINKSIEEVYNQFFCNALLELFTKEQLLTAEKSLLTKQEWIHLHSLNEPDGSTSYKEFKLSIVEKNGNSPDQFILMVNDISDYINKNLIIKESEQKLKSIINNISDPLFILKEVGNELKLETANRNFFKLLNINKEDVLDQSITNFLESLFSDKLFTILNDKNFQDLKETEFQYFYLDYVFNCKISSMQLKDESRFLIISMNDITNQKNFEDKVKRAYEKEALLNKLKTGFIENISHEIRTPFNAISGYSEIIEDSLKVKDYETISELISLVKEVLGRVTNLFNNIIEISQIESKEILFEYVFLNCSQVPKIVYNKHVERARQKGVELFLECAPEEIFIRVDWTKFEKIINVLVDNAIKYTHYGKVVIRTFSLDNKAYITITDTGEGMNQEEVNMLQEAFSQEEIGYTRQYQGAGLGLTIASKLTKMMGGKFDIVSQKQIGTKVILTFPIYPVSNKDIFDNN